MTFLALAAAALALGLACAWTALGGGGRAARAAAAFAVLAAIGCAPMPYVGRLVAHNLTVIHEGGTARTVEALFGRDRHVGPLWRDAVTALAAPGEVPVFAIARLNLALSALAAAGLAVLAACAARRPVAAAVALAVVASSRGFWNGLHAETPAPAVWFAFVTAAPAWALLDGARARPPAHHLLALASLAVSAGLAAGVREEFVIVGAPLTLLGLATFLLGARPPEAAWAGVRSALVRLLHAGWPVRLGAALALLVAACLSSSLPFHPRMKSAAAVPTLALHAPAALLGVAPAPVVALAVLGVASLLRGGAARALTAVATASLLSVYLVASHGVGREMSRYGLTALMLVWLAALAGWGALERFATERGWHATWRSSLALLTLFYVPAPWGVDPTGPAWWDAASRGGRSPFRRLADRTAQREARLIVRSLTAAPGCLHVTRVRLRGEPRAPLVLLTFARDRAPEYARDARAAVRDLRAEAGRCLRYVRSLDCSLRRVGALCDDDLRGADPVDVADERFAPYDDPAEYGEHAPEVRYGVWNVRMEAP